MAEPTPEVIAEAKTLGWVPEEEFKGAKERWVDATTFVERGHSVMPILKKNNQDLLGKLSASSTELAAVKATLAETNAGIQALKDFQAAEVKRQVGEQVATLRAQLREAKKGDDEGMADLLEERLDAAKDKLKEVSAPPPPAPAPPKTPAAAEPWAQEFASENAEWFPKDKKRTALFAVIADELFATGLRGRPLMDQAKDQMEKVFSPPGLPDPDKAEGGGRGGAGADPSAPKGRDFRDLPADAKAQCNADLSKFVGPKKAFKTEAEWKKHYVEVYFAS